MSEMQEEEVINFSDVVRKEVPPSLKRGE